VLDGGKVKPLRGGLTADLAPVCARRHSAPSDQGSQEVAEALLAKNCL
jgi:hypothetical protein